MSAKRLVLVEGESDKRAILAIGSLNAEELTIDVAKGFPELCKKIESGISAKGIERFAIVFDANGDPKGQWEKVREEILAAYGRQPAAMAADKNRLANEIPMKPTDKEAAGKWVEGYKPWIKRYASGLGLWMMPGNGDEGALEEFLVRIVDQGNPYWIPAQDYVKEVSEISRGYRGYRIFPEHKIAKARLHAWLAIQESTGDPPGKAIDKAIRAGALDIRSKDASNLKKWLEGLR